MTRAIWLVPLLLAACDRGASVPDTTPGGRLEAAAVSAGLIRDPSTLSINGAWARDTDRLCIVGRRIGVAVDYGEGQGCSAAGSVQRRGNRLDVAFGACRFIADFDGQRIRFPATLPAECELMCSGRASLAALSVEQQSASLSEAVTLRGRNRKPLCGD